MPRIFRTTLLATLAFVVVVSALAIVPARADVESFTLYGSQSSGWGFTSTSVTNPGPNITVTQGDTVILTLHSLDIPSVLHDWFIDYNNNLNNDSGEPISSDFSGPTAGSFTFTADRVGTFTYRCKYHLTTMTGKITIQAPPTFELYGDSMRGWGFENTTASITKPGPTLTVNQSATVTIDLTSVDGQEHSWFIDINDDRIQQSSEPHSQNFTSSVRFTFTPSQVGTFVYRCQFHPTAMYGNITIRSTGGTPTDNTVLIVGGVIVVVAIVAVAAAIMMRRKKP